MVGCQTSCRSTYLSCPSLRPDRDGSRSVALALAVPVCIDPRVLQAFPKPGGRPVRSLWRARCKSSKLSASPKGLFVRCVSRATGGCDIMFIHFMACLIIMSWNDASFARRPFPSSSCLSDVTAQTSGPRWNWALLGRLPDSSKWSIRLTIPEPLHDGSSKLY